MRELEPSVLESLRNRLAESEADQAWSEHHKGRDQHRLEILPQIADWLRGFLDGELPLAQLREEFDRRTRSEWRGFGFKGMSGAMFLNMLVKYFPRQAELEERLREVLHVPSKEEQARAAMVGLHAFLEEAIERREVTRRQVQPSRLVFFLSALWHVQDPEAWPLYFPSVRNTLEELGAFQPSQEPAASYLAFREVFQAAREAIGGHPWRLEHALAWAPARPPGQAAEPAAVDAPVVEAGRRVWLLAPGENAASWEDFQAAGEVGIGWEFLGDLTGYASREAILAGLERELGADTNRAITARACWEFAHEMAPGDVVLIKRGRKALLGAGVVESECFRREGAVLPNRRRVRWVCQGDWETEQLLAMKTLTEVSKDPYLTSSLLSLVGLELEEQQEPAAQGYTLQEALQDLFMPRERLERCLSLLRAKKNLVLQGPPGTGKTFVARRLAALLAGSRDPDLVRMVQFHQSYSYEDFVQGFRPREGGGFVRRAGPFMEVCSQALQDPERPYVLVIDEINRGNLSKIFGELLMLIEHDKRSREWGVRLTYARPDEEDFFVPPNLYLIGTMNTADRSLALVDYALRRRFAFETIEPAFAEPAFLDHLVGAGVEASVVKLIRERLTKLNKTIRSDGALGAGFEVGHSSFCGVPADVEPDEAWYQRVVETELLPLLQEYWFDASEKLGRAEALLLEGC